MSAFWKIFISSGIIGTKSKTNSPVLSIKLFFDDGIYVGLNDLNGVILGDQKMYSGYAVYTIQTKAAQNEQMMERV